MSAPRIEIHYDERFGMYAAVAPDRYNCTGLGRSPEEARARLELALSLWFDAEGAPLCDASCLGDSRH